MAKKWGAFTWGDGTLWGEVAAVPADDYPARTALTIKINGTDRTGSILPDSIEIEDIAGVHTRTCRLSLRSVDWTLTELDEIEITDQSHTRLFAGYIWRKQEVVRGVHLDYDVDSVCYTWELTHPSGDLVHAEYESQSDQTVVQDFMADCCPEIEVSTYVAEVLADTGHMIFDYETPYEALERLAKLSGASWYMDYGPVIGDPDKKAYLHYFATSIETAAYNLSDSPNFTTTLPYYNLIETTEVPTANKCIVVGKDFVVTRFRSTVRDSGYGGYLIIDSSTPTAYLAGVTWSYPPIRWYCPARFLVVLTLVDGTECWAYFGHCYQPGQLFAEKTCTTYGVSPDPGDGHHAISAWAFYDADSDYGRWIITKIVDVDLEDQDHARVLADQKLLELAATPSYTCYVHQPGLRAGRSITLTNSKRGLSAESLVIRRITTRFSTGGGIITANLEMGKWRPRFEDVLRKQFQDGKLSGTIAPKGVRAATLVGREGNIIHWGTNNRAALMLDTYNDQVNYFPVLEFRKSHFDTLGKLVDTIDTEVLGLIGFKGVDTGQAFDYGAYIKATQDGAADTYLPAQLEFITHGDTAANEPITIDKNGNLGVHGQQELRFYDDGNHVGFVAPTLAADQIWALPTADGTADQVLKTDGAGNLGWVTGGTGDVAGPASSTDNAIALWDGTTGKLLQDSALTVSSYGGGTAIYSAADLWLRARNYIFLETLLYDIDFRCAQDIDLSADGDIELDAAGAVTISAGSADIYINPTTLTITTTTHFEIQGDLDVGGTLTKGGGSFKIDHPLDPGNKWLYHSMVESPDMLNVYNDNAALDKNGKAVIELPRWFMVLNRDFRYQLTPIEQSMPGLYVSREIQNNAFEIAGGMPGGQVSWQITGIRQDKWANEHRIQVEVDKED